MGLQAIGLEFTLLSEYNSFVYQTVIVTPKTNQVKIWGYTYLNFELNSLCDPSIYINCNSQLNLILVNGNTTFV